VAQYRQQNPFCEATHDFYDDMIYCRRCEMYWDGSDPFPPACQFEANHPEETQS
jgi:hypothetical protein